MKTIKISGGVTGVIATGSYQNLRPCYTWEETIENCDLTDEQIKDRIQGLYNKCYNMLEEAEQKAIVKRIQAEREDLRFMISPSGKILPSVTSIINYDADFFVSPEDLTQYASQGNIIDARVKHYINTGQWIEAKDIKELWTDIVILTKGSLKLDINVGDFPTFLEKHPIKEMTVGKRFFSDELGYCGEPDFIGMWKGEKTVFDVKRTPDKVKNGLQLSAYCKALGVNNAIIVPLNDKTQQGYSKPIVYGKDALEGYFSMFKKKQKAFRKRYGV